jgi:hypothetical protein
LVQKAASCILNRIAQAIIAGSGVKTRCIKVLLISMGRAKTFRMNGNFL